MFQGRIIFLKFCIFVFSISVFCSLFSQDFAKIPEMTNWVVDTTQTLTSQEISKLNNKLQSFQKQKGSQIAVVIISSTEPETIEDYCLKVAEKWKVGRLKVDDGVLLCIAKEDRKLRLETGYGAEVVVTDAKSRQIIDNVIVPKFKSGLFMQGIDEGTTALIMLLSGENFENVEDSEQGSSDSLTEADQEDTFLGLGIFFGIFAFILHLAVPTKYLWKVGAGGAGISFLVSIFIIGFFQSLIVAVAFLLVTMFGMQILWAILTSSGRGGSSSGGSSFGGGGGGSFGGGGSSGSW